MLLFGYVRKGAHVRHSKHALRPESRCLVVRNRDDRVVPDTITVPVPDSIFGDDPNPALGKSGHTAVDHEWHCPTRLNSCKCFVLSLRLRQL